MRKLIKLAILIALLPGCASQKSSTNAGEPNTSRGHTRTIPVESIDANTYLLVVQSIDKSYGYTERNAIKVGSEGGSGPLNERRFLNGLLGPNGEAITYTRTGSCCAFKTPNGMIDNMGMLDRYSITVAGNSSPIILYLNMYDKGDLQIPVGFTAKKKP